MSIVKSVLIYGCEDGSTGGSLAMALAGKPVHVFACSSMLGEMTKLGDIPNITTIKLNPTSASDEGPIRELIAAKLRGGHLNMLIHMGSVGQDRGQQSSAAGRLEFWLKHVKSLPCLSRALQPFLVASNGIIIDFINHELIVQETMIYNFHVDPIGIASTTGRLRDEFEPLNVKILTISHGGEYEFTDINEGGSGAWPDVPALATDIIRDLFRLPGEGRVL